MLPLCLSIATVCAQTVDINSVTSPTANNLNSVCIVNNSTATANDLSMLNAWAVGDGGTIVMWDGSSWSTVNSPTTMNLYSVVFTEAANGWAVGGSGDKGVILHYNGTWALWDQVSFSGEPGLMDSINSTLYGVNMDTDGQTGWAVGSNGVALMWSGAENTWYGFTDVSTNTLRSVAMMHGMADAWIVGDGGTILHWDGAKFNTMTSGTTENLYTIKLLNSTNAVAAGGSGNSGVVLMLSDGMWSKWDVFNFGAGMQSTINSIIYSVDFTNATSGWACGSNGLTMYWTGSEWDCNSNVVSGSLKGISMIHSATTGAIQAWAVGESGAIVAFNGAAWVPEFSIVTIPLLMSVGLLVAVIGKAKLFKKTTQK